jgi:hypothetical protein
MVYQ